MGPLKKRIKCGKADSKVLEEMKPKKVKFTTFQIVDVDDEHLDSDKLDVKDVFGESVIYTLKVNELKTYEEVKIAIALQVNHEEKNIAFQNNKKKMKQKTVTLRLTEEDISQGLEYLFKKSTQEILKFENMKEIQKIAVMKEEILYCSSRILESQELKSVGCLKDSLDIETFTGVNFCVPVISKHSPLAVSIALHLHYNVYKHRGVESTFRMSLQHTRIMQGKQLFKEVSDDCIYCKKLRQKYVRQLMGPFNDAQLCISPIFYFTYIDMWGPLAIYCPGYEKRTRSRQQKYEVHMLVMVCAVTAAVNCQIIEKKDTGAVLDGLNRFFNEVCVPKICYPDKDGAIMKALQDGEIDVQDMEGRLHRERGIYFQTCLPQGHYQHGRVERRIKMLQESLERSEIRKSRCTATGWQTICKAIEHEVNSVPTRLIYFGVKTRYFDF